MADPAHAPALQVRLFGPLDIYVHGVPLAPLRSRKGRWLLALLILRPSREVEREWLAGTLWPDSDDTAALATLRRTLTDLRQALGDQAGVLRSPTPRTLLLDLSGVQTDLGDFDAAIAEADEESLARAVGLYRGPLLEGCFEDWIVPEREARAHIYLQALETLAEKARERRQYSQAIHYLQRLVQTDPLQESAQRSLMYALAESGSLTSAIQAYQDFRRILRRDLNADPDPETTALFQQLRAEARTPKAAPTPPIRPEARLAPAEPADASPSLRPPSLPLPLTPFVGREREIEELVVRLETTPLLSLTGTGGVGKTRLSLRIAEEAHTAFPGGVWFVDLSALTDPGLVAGHVAATLKVREQSDRPLIQALSSALSAVPTLLILDNCEHLLDACARLTKELLESCPRLRILVTSRQSLGIPGETVWRVPSLSLPEVPHTPLAVGGVTVPLVQYEAIQLFVSRAIAVMPTFALNAQTAGATVEICRRLDGIPLALELAAARMNVLSVTQIADRLEDRFRLLTTGSRIGPRRQQTLQAALDWSYDLLTEPERCLLRRLSIFVGGWTLAAAEAICPDRPKEEDSESRSEPHIPSDPSIATDDVLDLMGQLVDRSLVTVEGGVEGVLRYRLMDSIRQYAQERLRETGEEQSLLRRHNDYYLLWTEGIHAKLIGAEQGVTVKLLEAEHDNLRAVLSAGDPATCMRLAGALWRFWWIRGYYTEGRAWLRAALAHADAVSPSYRAQAVGGAAALAGEQGDLTAAQAYAEEFLAIRRQIGDPVGIARALNNLGLCFVHQARYEEARPLLEESLALKRAGNDLRGIAQSLGNLGLIAFAQREMERACMLYTEAMAICRSLNDRQSVNWVACSLGDVALQQNDLKTARSYFEESLRISQELQETRTMGVALDRIGIVACREGNHPAGLRLMSAAESHLIPLGSPGVPSEKDLHPAVLAEARVRLGAHACDAAWNAGKTLSIDQAIALALNASSPDSNLSQ
jgi:predicted ATPase/DNA-binding SARP family transcriptional activator